MTNRIVQVNSLLKRELGDILLKELDLSQGVLATVTRVEASGNLQQAKVYISVMPEEKREEVLVVLKASIYDMQQTLNKRLKMRPVPRIQWMTETKTAEAQRIEELLDRAKNT